MKRIVHKIPRAVMQLHRACSRDINRESLAGIYIAKLPGAFPVNEAVATNGHYLTKVSCPLESFGLYGSWDYPSFDAYTGVPDENHPAYDFMSQGAYGAISIPSRAAKAALVGAKAATEFYLELTGEGRAAILICGAGHAITSNVHFDLIPTKSFPDYTQVIPEGGRGMSSVGLDIAYLAEFAAYLKSSKMYTGGSFEVFPKVSDPLSPVLINVSGPETVGDPSGLGPHDLITFVIMPIRLNR